MSRSTQETSPVAGAPSGARARLAALGLTLHGPHPPHPPLLAVVTHNGVAYVSVGNSQVPLSNVTAVLGAGKAL